MVVCGRKIDVSMKVGAWRGRSVGVDFRVGMDSWCRVDRASERRNELYMNAVEYKLESAIDQMTSGTVR